MAGACLMPIVPVVDFGPATFFAIRILVAVGLLRVFVRGERPGARLEGLDVLVIVWAVLMCTTSVFHESAGLVGRLGKTYDTLGAYFLIRTFVRSVDDLIPSIALMVVLLLIVGIEMSGEQLGRPNLFYDLFDSPLESASRGGVVRAQGPFSHPILAGTMGAAAVPFVVVLWRQRYRLAACLGGLGCVLVVTSSASSGPILSATAALGAVFAFPFRSHMRALRWVAVLGYLSLELVMNAPAYYIVTRIDFTGSSASWHRAGLIDSAFRHFNEWWLVGTDYTRHWMATGVYWSEDWSDITNEYLAMGVNGGILLMVMFILILTKGFSLVGQSLSAESEELKNSRFVIWCLGAVLFTHAVSFMGVTYFDQSVFFLYFTLASIASVCATRVGDAVPGLGRVSAKHSRSVRRQG